MRLTAIAAVCVLLVSAAWAQPDSVTLRLRHQAGQTLSYRASVSGTGSISLLDEQQPVTVRGRFTRVEHTLSQVGPDTWEVRVTIEDPSLTFRAGEEEQTLTMRVPPLTQVVDDRGGVSQVRGWDAAQAEPNAPGIGDAVRPLLGLIQDEGLPERALQPGEKWTAKAKLKMPDGAERELEQRFEFVGFQDLRGMPCAEIRSAADIPVQRQLPADAMGLQVSLVGVQHIESASLFAYQQGMLVRQGTNINLDLKTSTVLSPETPDAAVPGAISLRVKVALDLEP